MTERQLPESLRNGLSLDSDELTLVRSGLDDTMRLAYQEISEAFHRNDEITDFRTAAFYVAIKKIVQTHLEMGV